MALATLGADALAGASALVRANRSVDAFTASGQETAATAFALYLASSVVSMNLAWGGVLWQEPRFQAALSILFVGGIAFIASLALDRPRVRAVCAALVGPFALYRALGASLDFHPDAPVRRSGVVEARLYFYAILASLAVAAIAFWVTRYGAWQRHHASQSE